MSAAEKKSGLVAGSAAAKREEEQQAELQRAKYFHGGLPRENAESEMVLRKDGEWLLRYNDRSREFVIVIRVKGKVQHFRICFDQKEHCYYVRSDRRRKSVKALVEYHTSTGESLVAKGGQMKLLMEKAAGRDRWELKTKDLRLEEKVGEGAFGEVWKAMYMGKKKGSGSSTLGTGSLLKPMEVAVKLCKEHRPDTRLRFEKEAMFQLRFHHKHIVATVGVVVSEPTMMIVLEYMPKGSLLKHLRRYKKTLSEARLRAFCVDAARGLAYVESHKALHRDIAARNCLVGLHDEVKVADFGQAKSQDTYKMLMGKIAVKWMAPESMRTGEFTNKTDVYSYGVLMWEIFSLGQEPWSALNMEEVKKKVLKDRGKLPIPAKISRHFSDVMKQCWEYEPESRPTFAQIVLDLQPDYSGDASTDPA